MKIKKSLAVLLCIGILAGIGGISAAAAGPQRPDDVTYVLYDVADWAAKGLLKGVTLLFPPIGTPCKMPESVNFYQGMEKFVAAPSGDKWELGYAKAPLTRGLSDEFISKLFVTGAVDPFGKRTVSEILDPPMAHVTALSDGRNGTAVFVSLDAFGITSVDVGRIRAALKDFAADPANNIISINVSALHQHSVIDTLGMNGNILAAVFANTFAQLTGWYPPFSGKNQDYMKNVTKVVADTVKEAVGGMEEGTLHYGKADVREYINEKRAPDCFDPYFHRLRFKPTATASPETWLCNAAIHPTGLGTSDTKVSGDWPYFIGEALKDYNGGTNFQFINGAELAMGIKFDEPMPDATGYQRMRRYGSLLADKLKGITGEIQLPSLLNIAHKEYLLPVDNPLHLLFFRLGAIESSGRKKDLLGLDLELKTELGYMELGGKVAVALVPGELEPALAFDGNGLAKEESYRREEYKFTPMREMAGPGIEHFMVFGLTNDQIGYILLPNDIAHFVVFGNEEVNTASTKSAPLTLAAFKALTESVR